MPQSDKEGLIRQAEIRVFARKGFYLPLAHRLGSARLRVYGINE